MTFDPIALANLISNFITHYERSLDYYREVARLCAEQCQLLLKQDGIRAIVTYRPKQIDRIPRRLEKTQQSNEKDNKKPLETIEECYEALHDLAGVRIALYFPGDDNAVKSIIYSNFEVKNYKTFTKKSDEVDSVYEKRFSGYNAEHYHVHLKKPDNSNNDLDKPDNQSTNFIDRRYFNAKIEIQVASVLMHAWSEVEHDLIYKPFSGELSKAEYAILDELNGLVLAGEIALERLQDAVKTRVSEQQTPFKNQYELNAFLNSYLASYADGQGNLPSLGKIEELLSFLKKMNLDSPKEIKKYLESIDLGSNADISRQIISTVIGDDPEICFTYIQIQKNSSPEDNKPIKYAALQYAINQNKDLLAKTLIESGVEGNFQEKSLISNAVIHGSPYILRLLLENGEAKHINSKWANKVPLLLLAVTFGNQEKIKILLEYKIDVNARTQKGETILTIARGEKKEPEIINMLLLAGATE